MKLTLRFVLPLLLTLSLMAYFVLPLVDTLTFRWFIRDIEMRTKLISSTMQVPLVEMIKKGEDQKIQNFFSSAIQDERLFAVGHCDEQKQLAHSTPTFADRISCSESGANRVIKLPEGAVHVAFYPIKDEAGKSFGRLVLVHDLSFAERRSTDTKTYVFYFFATLGILISALTVLIAEISFRGIIKGVRKLITSDLQTHSSSKAMSPELRPIMKDLRSLMRDMESGTRDVSHISWTPKSLKEILQNELKGDEVLIVSNREPYIHQKKGSEIEVQFPASGLVTALEPIMRACSGTWIAHGSGSADKETVDKFDHVQVPPDNPSYQIRRVWLSKEEEQGFYYGFANEGLWALCHIAHVRPTFRSQDWEYYKAVNRKFADAVIEEAKTDDPVVLVQDYHFALLPKMIKERLPKATVITFWHIPFPNPEVFGVCPFREELIEGMLGSTILGFHTKFHCNNFNEAVDRFIEARIDRETSTVCHKGEYTAVNRYPISIEYPVNWNGEKKSAQECREYVRKLNGLPPERILGVGVDRLDYTKGILERFLAVERLLELYPDWIGKFTFIQIAAPSRSAIDQYRYFDADVRKLAQKINERFSRKDYEPILLKIEHHTPSQVYDYYRGTDICFVSSLHDGMNLVAKEFVAAREDDHGVLILSQFTGASRELVEALIVNPYNIDQCAEALKTALEMPPAEQASRMRSMRGFIQEYNVYRWAGRMLMDAARIRKRSRFTEQSEVARSLE